VEILFRAKGVTNDADKILIIGGLIRETNTLAFYTSNSTTLTSSLWGSFKTELFQFALPPLWRTSIHKLIYKLKISNSKTFLHTAPALALSRAWLTMKNQWNTSLSPTSPLLNMLPLV